MTCKHLKTKGLRVRTLVSIGLVFFAFSFGFVSGMNAENYATKAAVRYILQHNLTKTLYTTPTVNGKVYCTYEPPSAWVKGDI